MAYEIVMPRLGLTMEEGRVVEWYKADGETVEAGEPLLSVETDKVVLDVEAPVSGLVYHGPDVPPDPLPIGTVIGYILQPGESLPTSFQPIVREVAAPAESAGPAPVLEPATSQTLMPASGRKLSSPAARRRAKELGIDWRSIDRPEGRPVLLAHVEAAAQAVKAPTRIEASPVARRLAEAAGIDLAELAVHKPGQRIKRADVEAAIAARQAAAAAPPTLPALAPTAGEVMPVTQIRRLIAQRMAESAHTTAAVPLTTEADATELVALRERLKAALEPRGMVVPTYTDLVIKLTGTALQDHSMLNACLQDDRIRVLKEVHIGVAVDTEAGLLVPVIRDVPNKSLQQIAEEAHLLAARARSQSLTPDELQGGTFTVTNLGMYGIDAFAPIINLPQCAILGVGRIVAKPAVRGGEIVPRRMMMLSLTFDHRVVDGGPAARFLNTVREFVEEPYLWLVR